MAKRILFSSEALTIDQVARTRSDTERSLPFYYGAPGLDRRDSKFIGYRMSAIREELEERLSELDRNAAFGALAALEASFRTDFLSRCYRRRRDGLSRQFRARHQESGSRVSLAAGLGGSGWQKEALVVYSEFSPPSVPSRQLYEHRRTPRNCTGTCAARSARRVSGTP